MRKGIVMVLKKRLKINLNTARFQQAPQCIAAGVLWIIATSVICARFVSPATGARWQIDSKHTYAKLI